LHNSRLRSVPSDDISSMTAARSVWAKIAVIESALLAARLAAAQLLRIRRYGLAFSQRSMLAKSSDWASLTAAMALAGLRIRDAVQLLLGHVLLTTSLYDDPAAGLCGDAPAGLDEHPEHGL
jgi:hypothetical protein